MNRFVSVIYCDDIRNEIGNKQSFVGIYKSDLYVADFPAILPKLCVVITVRTNSDDPFKSLKVRLLNFDALIAETQLPPEAMEVQQRVMAGIQDKGGDGFLEVSIVVVLSPFQLDAPMRLRVRVDADGEELKGSALGIGKAPQQAA